MKSICVRELIRWYIEEGRMGQGAELGFKVSGYYNLDTSQGTYTEISDMQVPDDHVFLLNPFGKVYKKPKTKRQANYCDLYPTQKGYDALRSVLMEAIKKKSSNITIEQIDAEFKMFAEKYNPPEEPEYLI